jgi:integrase
MGRRRTKHLDLPPHLHLDRVGTYYYITTSPPRRWINLGKDRTAALRRWAELEGEPVPAGAKTFEIVPRKALATQRDNRREAHNLLAVFGEVDIEAIQPADVRRYLDLRARSAPVRAKREKALLSHVINCAREWGMSAAPNPCLGIRGPSTPGRDRYIEDAEYRAVWEAADQPLRDAMDLALLTGQRPADVLRLTRADLRAGELWLQQRKTGKRLRIAVQGELAAVVQRCLERAPADRGSVASLHLVRNERGAPLTLRCLQDRFRRARERAGVRDCQFRDIRAKAATDAGDLAYAQRLLGHQSRAMTEHYTRDRAGDRVRPLR